MDSNDKYCFGSFRIFTNKSLSNLVKRETDLHFCVPIPLFLQYVESDMDEYKNILKSMIVSLHLFCLVEQTFANDEEKGSDSAKQTSTDYGWKQDQCSN